MTISSLTNRVEYLGTGAVSTYAYPFKIFNEDDLLVVQVDTSDVETELIIDDDYTVSGVGTSTGGNITLVAGNLTSGYSLIIRRKLSLVQSTDIRNQGSFFPEAHENQFDKFAMIHQQQQDELDRSFKISDAGDPADFDASVPREIIGQANVTIMTNATGDGMEVGPSAAAISAAAANAASAAASAASAAASAAISNKYDCYNVKNYSATGDGVADDTAEIQAAIDALELAGGGALYFPPGTYKISSTLTFNASKSRIFGDFATIAPNMASSICLNISGTGGAEITDILVEGLRFVTTSTASTSGSQQCIQVNHARRVVIRNNYIQDFAVGIKFNANHKYVWAVENKGKTIGAGGSGSGGIFIYAEGEDGSDGYVSDHVYILNNYVDGCIYAYETKFIKDAIIAHNKAENITLDKFAISIIRDSGTGDEVPAERGIIHGNIIKTANNEGIFAVGVNINVTDNIVQGCGSNGLHTYGANMMVANNIVYSCVNGGSFVFDTGAFSGDPGVGLSTTVFDSAKSMFVNNIFHSITETPGVNFNGITESVIRGNTMYDHSGTGTTYAFRFESCTNNIIEDNFVHNPEFYGYRLENTSTGNQWNNNRVFGSPTVLDTSLPGDYAGTFIQRSDFNYEEACAVKQTTDATVTTVYSKTLTTNSLCYYEVTLIAKSTSGAANRATYTARGIVYRIAGGAVLEGNTTTDISETSAGMAITVDVSSNDFRVRATGVAATNIGWVAYVKFFKREI